MADEKKGIGLKYKLLAFMLAISIIPLSAVSFMAINTSQSMGNEAVENTDEMGKTAIEDTDEMGNTALEAAQEMGDKSLNSLGETQKAILDDLTTMGNETINESKEILTKVVQKRLETKTNSTVETVEKYMKERVSNTLSLKYVKESEEAYLNFALNHREDMLIYKYGGENIYEDVPVFRDIYKINEDGNIEIDIGYNVSSAYDYEDFEEDDWQDIQVVENDDNVNNYTDSPADDTEFVEYGLKDVYETIKGNPDAYEDTVYFPKVTIEIQGQERTTNLLEVDPQNNLANAVWMAATPTFTEGGEFEGVVVTNINHFHIMKLISDYNFGEKGFATLSEMTGDQADMELGIKDDTEWDQYVTSDGEPVASETYKVLPDGSTVNYGDVMEDVNQGVITYHPKTSYIGDMDISTREPDGSPTLVYLGDQMNSGKEGMMIYNAQGVGEVWGSYKPVSIGERTSNLNDWTVVCNALKFKFTEPMSDIEGIINEGITNTRQETNDRINQLDITMLSQITNLETSIKSSKRELEDKMEEKNTETTNEIDESVSQLQYTVTITVVVILVVVAISAYVIADRIVTPIKELTDLADRVSQGEMDLAVEVEAKDEIGELAESFNRMINSLKIAMQQLEEEM